MYVMCYGNMILEIGKHMQNIHLTKSNVELVIV